MALMTKMCFNLKFFNKSLNNELRKQLTQKTISSSVLLRQFSDLNNNNNDNKESVDGVVANPSKDIETIFLWPKVQTLLKRMTGFDDNKVFEIKPSLQKKANEVKFMTDKELNLMLEMSRNRAEEKLIIPPVLNPKEDTPKVLAKDFEIQGYIDSNFIFVDSSSGYSDQTRLIVVREPNGVLREANREERYRMNQMFFPKEERRLEIPKMFSEQHLKRVLDRHHYQFVLDRACLQFEPNDPKYIEICHTTYEHMSVNGQFEPLRSTRHFGPMSLYFAFNRKIDNLLNYFILNEAIKEGSDLVQLFYIIHSNDSQFLEDINSETIHSLDLIKKYIKSDSNEKSILELSLQKYEEIQREKLSIKEDIDRVHGINQN